MSVIQQIQEKYAKMMAIIIAVALIIFIVMLAFENGGSLLRGSQSDVVGKVDGKEINATAFRQRVNQYEAYLKDQSRSSGAAVTQEALQRAWSDEVSMMVIKAEVEKLGLQIGKRELGDVLYGSRPPQQLQQAFTDPATGIYDAMKAKAQIDQMARGTAEQKAEVNAIVAQSELGRLNEKYMSLLMNSINYPKWMVEKQNAENSQLSRISFVRQVYTNVPDSSVAVSDKEIEDFINKHKDQFKQTENRSISYVAFSAKPTGSDTTKALNDITNQKAEFDTTHEAQDMLVRAGSAIPYSDMYLSGSELKTANSQMGAGFKDTILSLPINGVFGPYPDGGSYVLAKMLETKVLPDSVKCRHILLGTQDRQGRPLLDDSLAHHLADSIATAIRNGTPFDSLAMKFSTDEAAQQTKGVMTFSSRQIQGEGFAPEFGKFILFDGKPGDKKVIKTQFGWHYIEILNFIKEEPHYKIAYLAKSIDASPETDAAANNAATQFAGSSRDRKSFDANADKLKTQGIIRLSQDGITPIDYRLQMGDSREMVKAIFAADLGDVVGPTRVGENEVVAVVTKVNKEGTMSVADARPMVEGQLRNHKKAEVLSKKLAGATTLEAAATALGGVPVETDDSLRLDNSRQSKIVAEPKVLGASFNPANKGKITSPIEGVQGVYVVRVEDISTTPLLGNANVAEERKAKADQRRMMYMQYQQQGTDPNIEILKAAAT
ncbi:MAG: SurA N-terminal domain-containing protein, partial [Chitinophagaceae bacterium]